MELLTHTKSCRTYKLGEYFAQFFGNLQNNGYLCNQIINNRTNENRHS